MMVESRPAAAVGKKRVLIIDDHELIRFAMAQMIGSEANLEVCGEAGDLETARALLRDSPPDVAVVDISLGDGNGLEFIKQTYATAPHIPMVVCSVHDESLYAERAVRAGARGYVCKQEPAHTIITAIRRVLDGQIYLSKRMTDQLVNRAFGIQAEPQTSPVQTLSDRELEVFELMGKGLSVKEIARQLHRSPKTIEYHREHIKQKLGAENSADVVRQATVWVMQEG